MLELLSPAGSPEAVIAAVQNGADAVYLGMGSFNARRGAKNFTGEEFEKAVRYCRIRGCKVYLTLNTLINDRELEDAVRLAKTAAKAGADGIIIQDAGLIRVLRSALPDMPLHGSTQMSVHNLAGAEAAAEMGIKRIVLARELSLEQISFITKHCAIETEVFVHGALCFCHSGQCYMSALIGRRSGNRGMCAQPCRMQYSLGGRMDDYPLSLKDNCLVDQLQRLSDAGVACAKIEGRMKRPEYTAIVTGIYSKVIKEGHIPTKEELDALQRAFSRSGFTQGYFTGERENMFGVRSEPAGDTLKLFDEARKKYADGELRRVPIHFYTVAEAGKPLRAIAFDDSGSKATAEASVPQQAKSKELTEEYVCDQMYKTGGTPYYCAENRAKVEEGLFVPAAEINELRRNLISQISEQRSAPARQAFGKMPPQPENRTPIGDPKIIFQLRTEDQLTEELAELKPDYIYVPAELMSEKIELLKPFTERGTVPVAVLPRVLTDNQIQPMQTLLKGLAEKGIGEALCSNLGHIFLAKSCGMKVRGDFGLNLFNSQSAQVLKEAGLLSATASFELRLSQIKDLRKPLDLEIIAYGRLPLMVSDQCIIKESSGRCSCSTPGQLSDRTGSVFPVVKEYGCRNVIYNAHKLYLADKKEDLYAAGLWGIRLLFSTESGRECAEVARGYMGLSDYRPNVLTRGLYYRGVD